MMRVPGLLGRMLGIAMVWLSLGGPAHAAGPAVVVSLDGAIGPATADYVVRAIKAAAQDEATVVVLRLDTPGGLDSAMRDIIRAMLASPVPVLAYVAPGGARAASAGTYILYASALAAMAPGTNLGAATPVSLFSDTPLPRPPNAPAEKAPAPVSAELVKVTNDSAAYIRGLAVMHGRNPDWGEQAVRAAVSLSYEEALKQNVVDIVAPDVPDLLAQADGRTVLANGRKVQLATRGLRIDDVGPDWRDRALSILTDPTVVYLLLLAGLAAIAFELAHPGIVAPGVVGTICLLVGGYGLNLLSVDYAGAGLVLLGIGLMAAEAFLPLYGAFILGGGAAFVIGSLMMFHGAGLQVSLWAVAAATVALAVGFGLVLAALVRARRRPALHPTPGLIGTPGITRRWHATEGEVLVRGQRLPARAAEPLDDDEAVRVVGVDGATLLVEKLPLR